MLEITERRAEQRNDALAGIYLAIFLPLKTQPALVLVKPNGMLTSIQFDDDISDPRLSITIPSDTARKLLRPVSQGALLNDQTHLYDKLDRHLMTTGMSMPSALQCARAVWAMLNANAMSAAEAIDSANASRDLLRQEIESLSERMSRILSGQFVPREKTGRF